MRRMIPQKLIGELVTQLEKQTQVQEMLNAIAVAVDTEEVEGYGVNFASDGETFLTISGYANIGTTSSCTIRLNNIPSSFLSKLYSAGYYGGTNSLGDGGSVAVNITIGTSVGYIDIIIGAGAERDVFTSITLSSIYKEA